MPAVLAWCVPGAGIELTGLTMFRMCINCVAFFMAAQSFAANAADDASLSETAKKMAREAMRHHIDDLSDVRGFPVFDQTTSKVVRVKFDSLHDGVAKAGDLYVSCADFKAVDGTKYDVDFLTQSDGAAYEVVAAIVHAKNGVKSRYDVAHD